MEFNSWNLYSRRRGHLCWNTVEELIEIDSTRTYMFDLGTTRWNCWVCFAESALQAVTHMIRLELVSYIQLIMAHDSHMCA